MRLTPLQILLGCKTLLKLVLLGLSTILLTVVILRSHPEGSQSRFKISIFATPHESVSNAAPVSSDRSYSLEQAFTQRFKRLNAGFWQGGEASLSDSQAQKSESSELEASQSAASATDAQPEGNKAKAQPTLVRFPQTSKGSKDWPQPGLKIEKEVAAAQRLLEGNSGLTQKPARSQFAKDIAKAQTRLAAGSGNPAGSAERDATDEVAKNPVDGKAVVKPKQQAGSRESQFAKDVSKAQKKLAASSKSKPKASGSRFAKDIAAAKEKRQQLLASAHSNKAAHESQQEFAALQDASSPLPQQLPKALGSADRDGKGSKQQPMGLTGASPRNTSSATSQSLDEGQLPANTSPHLGSQPLQQTNRSRPHHLSAEVQAVQKQSGVLSSNSTATLGQQNADAQAQPRGAAAAQIQKAEAQKETAKDQADTQKPQSHSQRSEAKKEPPKKKKQKDEKPPVPRFDSLEFRRELILALHERKGQIEKLAATEDAPFGNATEDNSMCKPFWGKHQIAIVGNGPIHDSQRPEIEAADVIIRINLLNNWRRGYERTDVWIARYSPSSEPHRYWGFTYMTQEEVQSLLDSLQAVFLLGGRQMHADSLISTWPCLQDGPGRALLLPEEPIYKALAAELGFEATVPSSGYVAIRLVQHCLNDSFIHIYGMNWNPRHWSGHNMKVERGFLHQMEAEGRLKIHPTPCAGLRECGEAADVDNTCHWSTDHRYMCKRGNRWLDLTWRLSPERRKQHEADRLEYELGRDGLVAPRYPSNKTANSSIKPADTREPSGRNSQAASGSIDAATQQGSSIGASDSNSLPARGTHDERPQPDERNRDLMKSLPVPALPIEEGQAGDESASKFRPHARTGLPVPDLPHEQTSQLSHTDSLEANSRVTSYHQASDQQLVNPKAEADKKVARELEVPLAKAGHAENAGGQNAAVQSTLGQKKQAALQRNHSDS